MIRIAAVGDVHFGQDSAGTLRPHIERMTEQADVFLLAGDLTRHGDPAEARVLAEELVDLPLPKLAVLGNHDHHADKGYEVKAIMQDAGFDVLEGEARILEFDETRVGIVGTKGFGGGFVGASASDFGEPEMKAFVRHTKDIAARLGEALSDVSETDHRIALLHYSPCEHTLQGERLEIYPFLGSYLLAEPIDAIGADLVLHGHAHSGAEKGVTPGGVHVRNVAQPVIRHAYNVYVVGTDGDRSREGAAAGSNVAADAYGR